MSRMANKQVLQSWVLEALSALGGSGSVLEVSKQVWRLHGTDMVEAGDLFYTWQYDIRWAAQQLRNTGVLEKLDGDRSGIWRLESSSPELTESSDSPTLRSARSDWRTDEIDAAVEAYMQMLRAEIDGVSYRKTETNRRVVELTGRSRGAVEFKFANISAVLHELGHRYVAGYKPRTNVQEELRIAVRRWVEQGLI